MTFHDSSLHEARLDHAGHNFRYPFVSDEPVDYQAVSSVSHGKLPADTYALVWMPKHDMPVKPFMAVHDGLNTCLLDAESRCEIGRQEYDVKPTLHEVYARLGLVTKANPSEVFSVINVFGRRTDADRLEVQVPSDSMSLLKQHLCDSVMFVEINDDSWTTPQYSGPRVSDVIVSPLWASDELPHNWRYRSY